ncbi:unnamed protein product, partial [Vitis vinifera]
MDSSILDSLGVEIIGVMSPVSVCMLLVVLLVYTLSSATSSAASDTIRTAANLVYLESPSDSTTQKLEGALLNALVFIVLIAIVTFVLVLLYYYNFTNFLKNYMRFSAFFVLGTMGGSIFLSVIQHFSVPIDSITCFLLLFNFTVVGVLSVFSNGVPIFVRQVYMVVLGIIVAAWFTKLPEWTTWVLLVALAVYDLVAVLAPGGPLKLLVELASTRDEELPALVYEARPVDVGNLANEEGETSPLVPNLRDRPTSSSGSSDRGIKLGLGDFVFYSVLVGRAAMYDLMTVYACYLAIISGLGCTLILLSVCHRALPALPISITLGVVFYFLTRLLMEPFVVGTSSNLMMF